METEEYSYHDYYIGHMKLPAMQMYRCTTQVPKQHYEWSCRIVFNDRLASLLALPAEIEELLASHIGKIGEDRGSNGANSDRVQASSIGLQSLEMPSTNITSRVMFNCRSTVPNHRALTHEEAHDLHIKHQCPLKKA